MPALLVDKEGTGGFGAFSLVDKHVKRVETTEGRFGPESQIGRMGRETLIAYQYALEAEYAAISNGATGDTLNPAIADEDRQERALDIFWDITNGVFEGRSKSGIIPQTFIDCVVVGALITHNLERSVTPDSTENHTTTGLRTFAFGLRNALLADHGPVEQLKTSF